MTTIGYRLRFGLAYGLMATGRRRRELVLPVITVATGSFLLVQVLSLTTTVRDQAATFGNETEIFRATVLIAIVVLLVGVVEVAVCTTRTITHRTREIGVLGANGIPVPSVVGALMVEPVLASLVGATLGGAVALVGGLLADLSGLVAVDVQAGTAITAFAISVVTSALAAVATSVVPVWRAASRPPVASLTSV
jgi:ABC-type antimicrobial peptide transport system permease subunit